MSKLIVEENTVSPLIPIVNDITDINDKQIIGNYEPENASLTISERVLEDMIYKLPKQDIISPREPITLPFTCKYDGFITFKTSWNTLSTNMSITINGKADVIRHYPTNWAMQHYEGENRFRWWWQETRGEVGYCVPVFRGDVIETTTPDTVYDIYGMFFKERSYNAR